MKVADALDVAALRDWLAAAPGDASRRRPIGMHAIAIRAGALEDLPAYVEAARGARPGPVVVVMDVTPMRRRDEDLKALVARMLSAALAGVEVTTCVLGTHRSELHADEAALAEADRAVTGAACVVSVGSGTVTDIAKDATYRAGIPFVAVQTAVSVNAFSDDMAVLLRNGVKRTVPSHWPRALVVDLDVIATAPPQLNRAGFGELMTMFTAPADWYLASVVGADDSWDPAVVQLFRDGGPNLIAQAAGVRDAELPALAELARQMTLTGIAMGVAGRTAPLSGAEHTISHLLDMAAEREGRALAFHGAQVGVAAVLVSLAWQRVLRDLDPRLLARAAARVPEARERARRRIADEFRWLDDDGAAAAECWRDVSRKLERWEAAAPRLAALAADWDRHREVIGGLVLAPQEIAGALRAAGAAVRFGELDPAPPPERARWAIGSCHLMRDRFTVADLVDLSGALATGWDERLADALLSDAAGLGAGL